MYIYIYIYSIYLYTYITSLFSRFLGPHRAAATRDCLTPRGVVRDADRLQRRPRGAQRPAGAALRLPPGVPSLSMYMYTHLNLYLIPIYLSI